MTQLRRLCVLVLALAPLSVALAQPKPALVKDIDQPGRETYQVTLTLQNSACGVLSGCEFSFPAVPAGKRLVVTWINAFYTLTAASGDSVVRFFPSGSVQLALEPPASSSPQKFVNKPISAYVEAGNGPAVIIQGEFVNVSTVFATLVGYYVSIP